MTTYQERVYRVLKEQHFIIGNREKKLIQARTTNGRRYFFLVAKRAERSKVVERFVKVPKNDGKKLLVPFERQIEFAKYVKAYGLIRTRGIITSNCNPRKGTPFVVMETFPSERSKIGFIEQNKGAERLGVREAKYAIDQLNKLHAIPFVALPSKLRKILRVYPGDYGSFTRGIFRSLNKRVKPLDARRGLEPFHRVLERRIGVSGIKGKAKVLLEKMRPIIDSRENKGVSLVHGDIAPQ